MYFVGVWYLIDVRYCDIFVGSFGWCGSRNNVVEKVVVFVVVDD